MEDDSGPRTCEFTAALHPQDGETGVFVATSITVETDFHSFGLPDFSLGQNGVPVDVELVSSEGGSYSFAPLQDLGPDTRYTASIGLPHCDTFSASWTTDDAGSQSISPELKLGEFFFDEREATVVTTQAASVPGLALLVRGTPARATLAIPAADGSSLTCDQWVEATTDMELREIGPAQYVAAAERLDFDSAGLMLRAEGVEIALAYTPDGSEIRHASIGLWWDSGDELSMCDGFYCGDCPTTDDLCAPFHWQEAIGRRLACP